MTQRGAIIDVVAVAVEVSVAVEVAVAFAAAAGVMTTGHRMKIIKPVTLCQRYLFHLFLKYIKFI